MLFSKDGRGSERRHSQEPSTGAGGFIVEEPSAGNNPPVVDRGPRQPRGAEAAKFLGHDDERIEHTDK